MYEIQYFPLTSIWMNTNEDRDKAHKTAAVCALVQSIGTKEKNPNS